MEPKPSPSWPVGLLSLHAERLRGGEGVGGWALPSTSCEALGKSPDLGIGAPSCEKRAMSSLTLCEVTGGIKREDGGKSTV